MNNKMIAYKRFSNFFLAFFVIALLCMIGSIAMQVKENAQYKDCTITGQGTLSSCFTQESGSKTYYFGVYSFQYEGQSWNFVNTTYYSKQDNVPSLVTIKHNKFKNKDDMKVKVQFDRNIAIPFIYAFIAIFLLALYIIYHKSYKQELLVEQARRNIKNMDDEIPME